MCMWRLPRQTIFRFHKECRRWRPRHCMFLQGRLYRNLQLQESSDRQRKMCTKMRHRRTSSQMSTGYKLQRPQRCMFLRNTLYIHLQIQGRSGRLCMNCKKMRHRRSSPQASTACRQPRRPLSICQQHNFRTVWSCQMRIFRVGTQCSSWILRQNMNLQSKVSKWCYPQN